MVSGSICDIVCCMCVCVCVHTHMLPICRVLVYTSMCTSGQSALCVSLRARRASATCVGEAVH